jgi:eukaryotic-like serine/threonine-protein kinase
MGEVWRARDPRLNRDVALKILPLAFSADPDRLARFEREAQVLASLSDPNIAAIHGIEQHDDGRALVLELVEGPTLADRLERGAIPLDDALPIARQIVDALEAAHDKGVVHRDLKPANIKLRSDGTVKVLDFGLAKLAEPPSAALPSSLVTASPTMSSPMTAAGIILGTAAYMSPEQARGKTVDKRTDVWAFGCVLFEMLSGRRAFHGEEVADVMVSVISKEPDWSQLPASTPSAIRRLLTRCLAKDRKSRLPDIAAARLELDDALKPEASVAAPQDDSASKPHRVGAWPAWGITAASLILAAWAIGTRFSAQANVPPAVARFVVEPPPDKQLTGAVAVSPDGKKIVVRATELSGGSPQLWLRELDSPVNRLLAGTANATGPFWSPDSNSVGFFQNGKVRALNLVNGTNQVLADAPNLPPGQGIGASWSASGTIIFSSDRLYRVPETGGVAVPVTTLDESRGDVRHVSPSFLADGKRFVFVVLNRDEAQSAVYSGSLDSTETVLVEPGAFVAAYASGYLLFGRESSIFARAIDPRSGQPSGDRSLLANDVFQGANVTRLFLGTGGNILAYVNGVGDATSRLVWRTREGKPAGEFGQPISIHSFWLAADEVRAVVERQSALSAPGSGDLWVLDDSRGMSSRFTTDPLQEGHPVFSPDGRSIGYFSGRPILTSKLVIQNANGLTPPEVLVGTDSYKQFTDWSLDGETLVFEERNQATGWDLNVVAAHGKHEVTPLLHTRFDERMGQVSPDGRFLAYVSNESGRDDVFVVSFPSVSEKWPISSGGGTAPRWRRDGKELFYLAADGRLMSVATTLQPAFQARPAKALFDLSPSQTDGWNYSVSKNGDRFLSMERAVGGEQTSLTVVLNWAEVLKKKP